MAITDRRRTRRARRPMLPVMFWLLRSSSGITSSFPTTADRHHAGRRRQSGDENEDRKPVVPAREWQSEDKEVGVVPGTEPRQPGQRDRHHEDVDREQIDRE